MAIFSERLCFIWRVVFTSCVITMITMEPTTAQVQSPEVVPSCPSPADVVSITGGRAVKWSFPIESNGSEALLSQTHSSESFFRVGTTTTTYIFGVVNNAVVTTTYEFSVPVSGPPIIKSCPPDIIQSSPFGVWDTPSAILNNGEVAPIQSQTHSSGSQFTDGVTCVLVTFINPTNALTAVCKFTISINNTLNYLYVVAALAALAVLLGSIVYICIMICRRRYKRSEENGSPDQYGDIGVDNMNGVNVFHHYDSQDNYGHQYDITISAGISNTKADITESTANRTYEDI